MAINAGTIESHLILNMSQFQTGLQTAGAMLTAFQNSGSVAGQQIHGVGEELIHTSDALTNTGEALENTADAVSETNDSLAETNQALADTSDTLAQTGNAAEDAGERIRTAGESTEEAGRKAEKTAQKIAAAGSKLQGIGNELTETGKTLTKNLTTPLLGAGVAAVKFTSDYESAFAGVRKTVDATEEEYQELSDSILEMSGKMPTVAEDISGVMEAAGQLGIQNKNLVGFTKTMVMLGDSTNLSANVAAESLAKFANVTNMSADDYARLGSTIVELGNNFATTEADIVGMGTRLASTGNLVGLSQSQIMAISTALSSCGIEAEAGGSAISKLLKQIDVAAKTFEKSNTVIQSTGHTLRELELMADQDTKAFKNIAGSLGMTTDELKNCMTHASDLNAFSDVAGISAQEFVKAWGNDAVGALGLFIDGLNDTERNGRSAVEILDEMGINEVRLSNAVLSLASSEGILNKAVDMANTAWDENTALAHEAEQRYATFDSRCKILGNQVKALGISFGKELMPAAEDLVGTAGNAVKWFGSLDSGAKRLIVNAGLVTASLGPVLMITGKLTSGVGALMDVAGTAVSSFSALRAGTIGLGTALTNIISPAGWVVLGLAAVTAAGVALYAAHREATKGTRELGEAMKGAAGYAEDFQTGLSSASGSVDSFTSELNAGFNLEDVKAKIADVQSKITAITSKAASERRELTQSEIKKLDEYFQKLRELTDREFEFYSSKLGALESVIDSGMEMTKENSQKVLAEAKTNKQEALDLAWQAHLEEIAYINRTTKEGSEERRRQTEDAKKNYQQRVADIEDSYGQIVSKVTGAYAKQNLLDSEFFAKLKAHNDAVDAENQRHNKRMAELREEANKGNIDANALMEREAFVHQNNMEKIHNQMAGSFDDNAQEIVGTLMAMVTDIQANNGQMTAETRAFAETFIDCYDSLPEDMREPLTETVNLLRQAMDDAATVTEENAPKMKDAIQKAVTDMLGPFDELPEGATEASQNAVDGVIGTFDDGENQGRLITSVKGLIQLIPDTSNTTMESHSPSRVMQRIGGFAIDGLIGGMESKKSSVVTSISGIMQNMLTAAQGVDFTPVGSNIVGGILSGLNARKGSLLATAGSLANSISTKIKSALQINSPSRVMMEIGEFTTAGMELGLMKGSQSLYETASAISRDTAEALSGITPTVHTDFSGSFAEDKLDRLLEAVERLADARPTMEIDGRPFGRLVREYV